MKHSTSQQNNSSKALCQPSDPERIWVEQVGQARTNDLVRDIS